MKIEQEHIFIEKTIVDEKDAIKLSFYGDVSTLTNMIFSAMKNNTAFAMSVIYAIDKFETGNEKSILN
jgi:hypothetical protein